MGPRFPSHYELSVLDEEVDVGVRTESRLPPLKRIC